MSLALGRRAGGGEGREICSSQTPQWHTQASHGDKESLKYAVLSQPWYRWHQNSNPLPQTPTLEGICGSLINTNRNKAPRLCPPSLYAVPSCCAPWLPSEEVEYTRWSTQPLGNAFGFHRPGKPVFPSGLRLLKLCTFGAVVFHQYSMSWDNRSYPSTLYLVEGHHRQLITGDVYNNCQEMRCNGALESGAGAN